MPIIDVTLTEEQSERLLLAYLQKLCSADALKVFHQRRETATTERAVVDALLHDATILTLSQMFWK